MYSSLTQLDKDIDLFFFGFFSHIGYYRVLKRVPWAVQQVALTICFIYRRAYILIPDGSMSKGSACQCRRHRKRRFDPWVRKISQKKKWQLTPVFLLKNPMDRGAW